MKYTQKEVQKNISTLSDTMDIKKKQRTELSQQINSIKKQIKEWEDLDPSQFRMF